VRCRSLARTEVRARRHVEYGRTSKLSRSSSTRPQASLRLEVCSRRTVCSRPPCVYAAARMPIRFRHELPALAQVQQVARGSAGAKNSRQNQEWPKNGVFRCACRAHTLALSTIRAHMAERGVLALCLQAPGETTAAVACAALASALSLPFSLPPPPSPHLRPHPRRSTREGDPHVKPLAGVWLPPAGRGTGCRSIMHVLHASARFSERSRAQPHLQTQKRQRGL
jgi:hypothetical protein